MADDIRAKLRAMPSLTGTAPALDEKALPNDPVTLFLRWLDTAASARVPEPHAMTLSTVGADGVPDARTLILKDVDESGWAFAGTASSRKGTQLAASPSAALSFWWQPLVRAVRMRGPVFEATREESVADLRWRSAAAQAGVDPDDWTLWRVRPTRVEFWQGSRDRRHRRIVYRHGDDGWSLTCSSSG